MGTLGGRVLIPLGLRQPWSVPLARLTTEWEPLRTFISLLWNHLGPSLQGCLGEKSYLSV